MPKKKYLFSHLEFLAFRMSEVIPLPFTLFPRPGTPYEVFWNSEHVYLYEVHFSLPLKERNLHSHCNFSNASWCVLFRTYVWG